MEVWKDIEGFEGVYQISNQGRVKSLERQVSNGIGMRVVKERIMKFGKEKDNYLFFIANHPIKKYKKKLKIHRLVAKHFILNPDNKPEVNHKDGDKSNNFFSNLEWCTRQENINHSWRTGLSTHKGENHKNTILTESNVLEIRRLSKEVGLNQRLIAKMFSISFATASRIINRVAWKDV